VIRHLATSGHDVTLLSLVRPEERDYLPELEHLCEHIVAIPLERSRMKDLLYWLRSHLTGRPFLVERDDSPVIRDKVKSLLLADRIDAIHADQVTMTQFAPENGQGGSEPLLVFDAHNATWSILERMRQHASWWLKPILSVEAARMKRYEAAVVERFDHTVVVSDVARGALLDAVHDGESGAAQQNERFVIMPIGIDTQRLRPLERERRTSNVLTLGTLHYAPNAEGIRWFLHEVWPKVRASVPEATLTIVGKNPPRDFIQYEEGHPQEIQVTGYVEDLEPYLRDAALMVVPVLAGSGMRVRILEGFSRGLPIVTTSIGLEGIPAKEGKEVLIADEPEVFASAVVRIIRDPELQDWLSINARKLATSRYDWRVALSPLDKLYAGTIGYDGHNGLK
jgi:glycosyltransferase involved in cell wall biosynthesis